MSQDSIHCRQARNMRQYIIAIESLTFRIFFSFVRECVPQSFGRYLCIFIPYSRCGFARNVRFNGLYLIVDIDSATQAGSIARKCNCVVLYRGVASIVGVLVWRAFLIVCRAPLTRSTTSTTCSTARAFINRVCVLTTCSNVSNGMIRSLFTLFSWYVFVGLPVRVLCFAICFLWYLVGECNACKSEAITSGPFTYFIGIVTNQRVRRNVASPFTTPRNFFRLFIGKKDNNKISSIHISLRWGIPTSGRELTFKIISVNKGCNAPYNCFVARRFENSGNISTRFPTVRIFASNCVFRFQYGCTNFNMYRLYSNLSNFNAVKRNSIFGTRIIRAFVIATRLSMF